MAGAARLQAKSGSAVSGPIVTLRLDRPTTSGNTVVVAVTDYYATADPDTSVTDDQGNTWAVAVNYANGARVKVFYASNIAGSASPTISVQAAGPAYFIATAVEYAGVLAVSPMDTTAASRATSASYSAGPVVTAEPDELLFGVHHVYGVSASFTPASGWSTVDLRSDGLYHQQQVQDRVVSAPGSYLSNGTLASALDVQSVVVAFKAASTAGDSEPPSIPTGLSGTAVSDTQIDLTWTASTDNAQVTGYKVYRDGVFIHSASGPSLSDSGLVPTTTYTYTVSAYDAAGNESSVSSPLSVATSAPSAGSRVVRWTRMPKTTGWPGYVGWTVPFFDPISQQTLFYVANPGFLGIFATDVYAYSSSTNTFTHITGTGSPDSTCLADRPNLPAITIPSGRPPSIPDATCSGTTAARIRSAARTRSTPTAQT